MSTTSSFMREWVWRTKPFRILSHLLKFYLIFWTVVIPIVVLLGLRTLNPVSLLWYSWYTIIRRQETWTLLKGVVGDRKFIHISVPFMYETDYFKSLLFKRSSRELIHTCYIRLRYSYK